MGDLTIAALAAAAGVGVETVRYYQRRALMPQPPRPPGSGLGGGIRRYGAGDVARLRFIKKAQAAEFSLEEIRELLLLDESNERARARTLSQRKISELDAKIADLIETRAALARLVKKCSAGSKGRCPIIASFQP
jgi:MerR family mercuric resistance operon transcriptional regulator